MSNVLTIAPQNMQEAMRLAEMLSNSNMVPNDYIGKPGDILAAMMMGHELGLTAMRSVQNIAVINGRPTMWGDALLALVQASPVYGGLTETFDEDTMTAACVAWRKGDSENKHTATFSKADAEKAGLWTKAKTPWITYPKRMLQMRARSFALRNTFADALSGLIAREEAEDIPVEERDITPDQTEQQALPSPGREPLLNDINQQLSRTGLSMDQLMAKGGVSSIDDVEDARLLKMLNWLERKPDAEQQEEEQEEEEQAA